MVDATPVGWFGMGRVERRVWQHRAQQLLHPMRPPPRPMHRCRRRAYLHSIIEHGHHYLRLVAVIEEVA